VTRWDLDKIEEGNICCWLLFISPISRFFLFPNPSKPLMLPGWCTLIRPNFIYSDQTSHFCTSLWAKPYWFTFDNLRRTVEVYCVPALCFRHLETEQMQWCLFSKSSQGRQGKRCIDVDFCTKAKSKMVLAAHACNPSYLGGWYWEDHSLRPAQANSSRSHLQNNQNKGPEVWLKG
jgi:hypothetical protein